MKHTSENKLIYIYGLIEPLEPWMWRLSPAIIALIIYSRVRYIGKADDPEKRYRAHISNANRCADACVHCERWIRILLNRGRMPGIVITESCTENEWSDREKFWIAWYRMYFPGQLTNLDEGGKDGSPSEETKLKMSQTHKGRQHPYQQGENHRDVKLIEAQVIQAREDYAAGATAKEIAKCLGVNKSTISSIVHMTSWKHLPGEKIYKDQRGEGNSSSKCTEEDVLEIRRLHATGKWSMAALAERFNVTNVAIRYIVRWKTWKHVGDKGAILHEERKNSGEFKRRLARGHIGEQNPNAKMSEVEVLEMRHLRKSGEWTHSALAKRFSIDRSTVAAIVNYKKWKHVR